MISRGTAITAMATPYRGDAVDAAAFAAAVDRQASGGTDAIAVGTLFGEGALLTFEERAMLFRAAVEAAAGRMRVFAHVGSNDTMRTVRLGIVAKRAGADAIIVVTPYYNRPGFRGLVRHVEMVAARVGLPIFVEIDPGHTGVDLTADEIAELARIDAVVGIVDGSGEVGRAAAVARHGERPLAYLSGDEPTAAMHNLYGGSGTVGALGNLDPAMAKRMVEACTSANGILVRGLDAHLRPLVQVLKDVGAPALKYALHVRYGDDPAVRLPLMPLGDRARARVLAALDLIAEPAGAESGAVGVLQ